MIPIRCYTCNKVVANKLEPYNDFIKQGISTKDALDKLKLDRYCCRRMIMGHVEIADKLLKYCDN